MRTTLLKSIFTLVLATASFVGSAQTTYLKEVIIANGSNFGDPDPATIGAYNPANNTYANFDSINVQSIQDVVVEDSFAYVAAESIIIKYNLNSHTRVDSAAYPAILSLQILDNYLVAGKYYGGVPYVTFYDKVSLDSLFSIDSIDNSVRGAIIKDSLYIPYNVTGSDGFSDTLGLLAVVDLNTNTVARIVQLDTAGQGASSVFAYGDDIFVIADGSGSLLQYHPATGGFDQYKIIVSAIGNAKWFTLKGSVLHALINGNIASYDVATHQIVDDNILEVYNLTSPSYFLAAAAYDTINEEYYITYTDYATAGYCLVYDSAGTRIDSFQTGVSNEAIALYYAPVPTGIAEAGKTIDLQVYPNPATDVLNISFEATGNVQISLKDLSGKTALASNVTANGKQQEQLSLANLANGLYLLQVTNGSESYTTKVVKL